MTNGPVCLVTTATGKIGTEFVHLLASDPRWQSVRAATRGPESPSAKLLASMNPDRVEPVRFDLGDPASLAQAFRGVTHLFLIAPFVESMAEWHEAVMSAATAPGSLEYVVKVSVTGARSPDSDPPPGLIPRSHWEGEEAVRRSGVAHTMIRPTIFAQHFVTVRALYTPGDSAFYLPTGDAGVAFLDCRDIAHFGAALLSQKESDRAAHEGQAYELTGPSAVTAAEISSLLSAVGRQSIRHVDGEEKFVARAQELAVSDAVKVVYSEAAGGWFSELQTAAFEAVTGRRPTSFAKFSHDYAPFFQAR